MLYEILCESLIPIIVLGIVFVVSKTTTPEEDITFTEIDNQLKGK